MIFGQASLPFSIWEHQPYARCHVNIPIIERAKYIDYLIRIILIEQPICYMLSERFNLLSKGDLILKYKESACVFL